MKSPHDILIEEKLKLQLKANLLEKRLKDDFNYLNSNSRDILISSAVTLLRPAKSKHPKSVMPHSVEKKSDKGILGVISDYSPIVWDFMKPMILAWGVRSFRSMITHTFSPKKKRKSK